MCCTHIILRRLLLYTWNENTRTYTSSSSSAIWCGFDDERKNTVLQAHKNKNRTIHNKPSVIFSLCLFMFWFDAVRFDLFIIRNSLNDVYRCNFKCEVDRIHRHTPSEQPEINCLIFINDQFHTTWANVVVSLHSVTMWVCTFVLSLYMCAYSYS